MCCGHDPTNPRPSRYAHDPRVTREGREGDRFTVTTDPGDMYVIQHSDAFAWVICHNDPRGSFLEVAGGGFAVGITSADAAIGALIGDPTPAAVAR